MLRTTQRASLFVALVASSTLMHQAQAATLPTTGLIMGLGADQNVTVTSGTVTGWGDLNGNVQRVSATVGNPTVSTLVTPNGTHAAINFTGADGLTLNNGAALAQAGVSTFVVADLVGSPQVSRIFVSDFAGAGSAGWASGISDSLSDQTKWYNGHGGSIEDSTGLTMTPGTAYLIGTSTSAGGSFASLYNGLTTVSNSSANTSINYNVGGQVGTIGYLATGGQALVGNIAEVLVYNNNTPGFNAAAVTAYLEQKFFLTTPEPSSFVLLGLAGVLVAGRALARRRTKTIG